MMAPYAIGIRGCNPDEPLAHQMVLLSLGFSYQDEPVLVNGIHELAIGTHVFTYAGETRSERALIVHARDDAQKPWTQAFSLHRITSNILTLELRDD